MFQDYLSPSEAATLHDRIRYLERQLEIRKPFVEKGSDLFCWCVENLPKFPPMQGDWQDDVKRRLLAGVTDAHVLDAYKAHHQKFHAECNISGPPALPSKEVKS